jgi:hypothetical protein
MFGHFVNVLYQDVFTRYPQTLESLGMDTNIGSIDVHKHIMSLPYAMRDEIEPPSRQRAEAACVRANLTLVLHPRATDVVSDTPGMLSAVRSSSRLRVLLDPAALLTEGMRAQWDDHAKRYAQLAEGLLAMRALFGVLVPKGELASASFEKGLEVLSAEVAQEKPTHGAASMNDLSLPVVYRI